MAEAVIAENVGLPLGGLQQLGIGDVGEYLGRSSLDEATSYVSGANVSTSKQSISGEAMRVLSSGL